MSELQRLQAWFCRQCNGEWEHSYGPTIKSCDNPGWIVEVQLTDTRLEDALYSAVSENVDDAGFQCDDRWMKCAKADALWVGAGDETKLEELLRRFLDWAELHGS